MGAQPVCLVCKKNMEAGFITDIGESGSVHLPRWCQGTPTPPKPLLGIQAGEALSSQREAGFRVVAYRCPECEALRLYAPSNSSNH